MTIVQAAVGFAAVAGAIAIVIGWFVSFSRMTKRFQDLERHTKENYDTNKILCKGMVYLLRHARTNNSIDGIKAVEDELVAFLAEK